MRLRNPFGRKPKEFPSHLWTQCPSCGEMLFNKQLERNHNVCQKCGHHFKLDAAGRVELLADARSFTETDADIVSSDPLGFVDSKPYPERIAAAQAKTGHKDAVLTGDATISAIPIVLAVMDFEFMGGSMGSVVGEKLTRAAERAFAERKPLVIVSASGGARELLADDAAHRAAHEFEVHDGEHERDTGDLGVAGDDGILVSALGLRRRDALGVRFAIDESERVARHDIGVGLAEGLRVREELDALERAELEVMAALLAHAVVALELFVELHLAAARALRPEMRRELFCLAAERVAQPHCRASSSRYQHSPATPGPVCVPMMGPASATQYSTQWNRSWTHSPRR